MVSSKFARSMRHRSKPAFCKAPPPPGPVDPGWPPRTGNGLCYWRGPNPAGPDYDCAGLAQFTWHPGPNEYSGLILQAQELLKVRVALNYPARRWTVYYEYWQAGVYKRAAQSYHPAAQAGLPVYLEADFYVRPDLTQHVTFRFSAFPLV